MNVEITNPILINGEKGLSIKSIAMSGNDLIVTLSDDTTLTAQNVKGAKGDTGVSIQSAALNQSGQLVITLTDNSTITSTEVVRGPKGDDGSSGADIVDGDVTDNQISLLKSDGSTVNLTGQINAASEAVGDMKATARNDVSAINYLPINTTTDTIHDKALEPVLWDLMKEYVYDDIIINPNYDGEFFDDIADASYIFSIWSWKGKWIRTINGEFQVSDNFSFLTYRRYPINSNLNKVICYLPELDKIIFSDYTNIYVMEINDADDINNYVSVENGENAQSFVDIHSLAVYNISISANPTKSDCYINFKNTNDGYIYYTHISNINNISGTIQSLTKWDLNNNGYPYSDIGGAIDFRKFEMSGKRIFWADTTNKLINSYDVENNTYSLELDYNTDGNSTVIISNQEGSLFVSGNNKHYKLNKSNDEQSLIPINSINQENSLSEDLRIDYYIPELGFIIKSHSDFTNMTLDNSDTDYYKRWISYDDGQSWQILFSVSEQSGLAWSLESSVTEPSASQRVGGNRRIFNNKDGVVFHFSDNAEPFNTTEISSRKNSFTLAKIQTEGYSDLFTVQSLYLNDDVKGFLRRKP